MMYCSQKHQLHDRFQRKGVWANRTKKTDAIKMSYVIALYIKKKKRKETLKQEKPYKFMFKKSLRNMNHQCLRLT